MNPGKILVFSAPSGSGKSTIIGALRQRIQNLHFSVSATSRAPRGEEVDGRDYYFISDADFRQRIAADAFIEYEEVYGGTLYGTLKSEVERQIGEGHNVVLDIDVKGAVNVKRLYGEQALLIFVQPPSVEVLRQRLVARATDSEEMIAKRVAKAAYELTFAPQFDTVVINDDLQTAIDEACQKVTAFLSD